MKLFGYEITDKHIDEPVLLDELSKPFFHQGGKAGCIVMHGIGGTPANVRVIAEELAARGYTVIAPFLAGHGTTVRDFGTSSDRAWIDSALAAYDRLTEAGCTEIVPVGLSLGGVVAGQVAARRPCKAAVLICAPLKMKLFLRVSKVLSLFFPYMYYGEKDHHDPAFWAYSRMLNGICTRRLIDLDRMAKDLAGRLPDVKCPVLAVWAGRDNKVDERSRGILRAGLTASAPLTETIFENSPHGCTYSGERDQVAKTVADFIDSVTKNEKEPENK